MKKPVVLILDNSIDMTGALKSVVRTSYDLREYFEFEFVIPSHSRGRFWIEGRGFNCIHELPLREINKRFVGLVLYIPYLFYNALRLRQIVKERKVSAIHVNDVYNLLPIVLRFLGCRIPYVCHIRFMPDRFPTWLFNFWLNAHLRYAVRIVVVSKSVLRQVAANKKIELIYNELPLENRYPHGVTNSNNSRRCFLYLSNFIQGKGQNFALEAFARLADKLPDWNIRFIGGDMGLQKNREYKMTLIQTGKDLRLNERIEWGAFTEGVELEYKQADIILNFSESESFSFTCLEAMFYGRPVIATDCGGPSEIIDHDITGLLVPNRNIEAMAGAMLMLALSKEKRECMAARASQNVRKKFSVENTSLRLKKVYDSALLGAND